MRNLEKSSQITEQSRDENLPLQATQLDVNNEKSVIEGINRTSEENERFLSWISVMQVNSILLTTWHNMIILWLY